MHGRQPGRPAGRSSREYLTPPRGRRSEPHASSEAKALIYNHDHTPAHRARKREASSSCTASGSTPTPCGSARERSTSPSPGVPSSSERARRVQPSIANRCLNDGQAASRTDVLMQERRHAADSMIVPTLKRAISVNRRGGSAVGLVPVGRDLPIGLDITSFLGPANPFGQLPTSATKYGPSDEELMRQLTQPSEAMSRVMLARLSHLRVVSAMWNHSASRAIQHTLDMDDQAVLVDVLNAAQPRLAQQMSLELAQDLMPALARLVDSEYEDYVISGLTTLGTILKAVGPTLRDAADGAARGVASLGVDLQMEERLERCEALRDDLHEIHQRLLALAEGKGRSAQLASRVSRSTARLENRG